MVRKEISFDEAKAIVLSKYRKYKIVNAFDLSRKYVFVLYPNSVDPRKDVQLDPFYSVRKDNGLVEEYTPLLDMDEFKRASKNPLPI